MLAESWAYLISSTRIVSPVAKSQYLPSFLVLTAELLGDTSAPLLCTQQSVRPLERNKRQAPLFSRMNCLVEGREERHIDADPPFPPTLYPNAFHTPVIPGLITILQMCPVLSCFCSQRSLCLELLLSTLIFN